MLAPGTRLGPYEVLSPLGAGGMGEVFKARDTRLDRSVAIKILPAELAQNAQLRLRFEREAKAISQLSHPNICTLYDVGDGYLVMELLDGETLADRISRGSMPLDQLIRIGTEIANALDRAHKAGIVHRDLKPSNVMLTKSGAKLLDFGLATVQAPNLGTRVSVAETVPKPLTEEGALLGTLQYMAPEQLEGRAVDSRTDIFALGLLIYEMVTGRRAFAGNSKASLIASILTSEAPSMTTVQPMTPPSLERVVRTCLAKDPDERWQSAHDIAAELRWIATPHKEGEAPGSRRSEAIAWGVAFVLAIVVAVAIVRPWSRSSPAQHQFRFEFAPPPKATFNFAGRDAGPIALAPDGSRVVFAATAEDGVKRLYVRTLDSVSSTPLAGTNGASYPFWSADGENIGFFAGGKLKRVSAGGGAVTMLCDATMGRGGAWNRDGTIVFAPSPYDPLYRVSASGGQPTVLTVIDFNAPDSSSLSHRWPAFFPDGRHFLYLQFTNRPAGADDESIFVASLDDPHGKFLMRAGSQTVYVDPGYLLFVRDSNLMAMPFDARALRPSGDPFPVAQHVQTYPNTASAVFSASNNGIVAYEPGGSPPISHLTWYDRRGKTLGVIGDPDDYEDPRLSPDGRRVAVTRRDPDIGISNIWIYDVATAAATRFTHVPSFDHYPSWSPDGKAIVFDSNRSGRTDVFLKFFGSDEQLLYHSPNADQPTDWTPDGSSVLIETLDPTTKWDLWIYNRHDRHAQPLLRGAANEKEGQVSPDGKWLAYTSDDSGKPEVYVTRFPSAIGRWQVSSAGGGGSQPRWRRDGTEIFFLSEYRNMMVAKARTGQDDFTSLPPQVLFPTRARYSGERSFDVSADAQRFLINTTVVDQPSAPIEVVVNWPLSQQSASK